MTTSTIFPLTLERSEPRAHMSAAAAISTLSTGPALDIGGVRHRSPPWGYWFEPNSAHLNERPQPTPFFLPGCQ
jgi:hypothetical protein